MEAMFLPQMMQHSVDGGKCADEYYYVTTVNSVEMPMPGKNVVSNTKHEGSTLQQYCEMGAAKDAHLNEADVVVLRLYPARLFRSLDKALRDKEGLEEWATCIAVMNKSVMKLMKSAPPGRLMCCWYKIACFDHFLSFRCDLMLSLLCDMYRSAPLAATLLLLLLHHHHHHHHLLLLLLLTVAVTCGQRRVLAAANLAMPLLKLLAVALYLPVLVGAER
jgi:hypothetical protein